MSLILNFPELRDLGRFLGLLPQAVARCRIDRAQVDLRHVDAASSSPDGPPARGFYIRFPESLTDDERDFVMKLARTVGRERTDAPPEEGQWFDLSHALREWFPVVRETPSERERQDLLVAVYEEGSLARVLDAAPKNPRYSSEIHFLHAGSTDQCPRYVFTLPKALSGRRWQQWLDEVNHERPSGEPAVRLFVRLPSRGMAAEYFVEHGWTHPVAHLPELHDPGDARWILLGAQASAEAASTGETGWRPARWTCIRFAQIEDAINLPSNPADLFDIRMPPQLRSVVADAFPRGQRRVDLPLRLHRAWAADMPDARQLEFRIQDAKKELLRLEHARATLVRRERRRFRLLLRFHARSPADDQRRGGDALPDNLQQFLHFSASRLDQFLYAFHQLDPHTGSHDLLTRTPVYYDDVHYGLADEVYYQMEYWHEWSFHVFVREGFELSPRIDDPHLGRAIGDAFRASLGDSTEAPGRCLLLHPRAGEAVHEFDASIVEMPDDVDHSLPQALRFLNEAAPFAEMEARRESAERLRDELSEHAERLQAAVAQVEAELSEEATRRWNVLRATWNSLAADVEQCFVSIREQQTLFAETDAMQSDFGISWTEFAATLFQLTNAITSKKNDCLVRLNAKHGDWRNALNQLEAAHASVPQRLDEIRRDMQPRVASVEDGRDRAKQELARAEAFFHDAIEPRAARARAEAVTHAERARRLADEAEHKRDEIQHMLKQTADLRTRLQATTEWLERHHESFGVVINAARDYTSRSQALLPRLIEHQHHAERTRDEWLAVRESFERLADDTHDAERAAFQQIRGLQDTLAAAERRTQGALAAIDMHRDTVMRRRQQAEQELRVLKDRWQSFDDECRRLREIQDAAASVKDKLDGGTAVKADLMETLRQRIRDFDAHRERRVAEILADLERTIGDLAVLADFEDAYALTHEFREAAQTQAAIAASFVDGRALSDSAYRRIWKGG